jgi:tRNA A-37 threonylcarbamoyl transferase component Bud32
MIGEQISHYRIIRELGRGGMGVVYLAEDKALDRKVALKFLNADSLQSDAAEARLIREARAASALDHPNISTIFEIGEWQGQHFIAMAYYEGETLAARIARGPVPIADAIDILVQIAAGLSRAHAVHIVHRDLKPGNIILMPDGTPKILDFGLAARESDQASTETRLTASGTTLGTVTYMSPEQARGEHVDHRADVWALGVIAYELLAGRVRFGGGHPAAIVHAILYETPPALKSLRPEIGDRLSEIIAKALERDRDVRYQSAGEFGAALKAMRTPTTPAASFASAWRALRRPKVAIPLIAVLAVALLLISTTVSRARQARWARAEAIPEVARLIDAERFAAAFALAERAEAAAPGDPMLARMWPLMLRTPTVRSDPAGATVFYREYGTPDTEWKPLGVTPLERVRMPAGYFRWRFEKPGYEPHEVARFSGPAAAVDQAVIEVTLTATGPSSGGMVAVPGSSDAYSFFCRASSICHPCASANHT